MTVRLHLYTMTMNANGKKKLILDSSVEHVAGSPNG